MSSKNNSSGAAAAGVAESLYRLLKENYPETTVSEILGHLSDKLKLGTGPVAVTTAVEISEEERLKIAEVVEGLTEQEREITFDVNPDIIGGLIINTGERVYDQSLKSNLSKLAFEINCPN